MLSHATFLSNVLAVMNNEDKTVRWAGGIKMYDKYSYRLRYLSKILRHNNINIFYNLIMGKIQSTILRLAQRFRCPIYSHFVSHPMLISIASIYVLTITCIILFMGVLNIKHPMCNKVGIIGPATISLCKIAFVDCETKFCKLKF